MHVTKETNIHLKKNNYKYNLLINWIEVAVYNPNNGRWIKYKKTDQ